MIRDEAARRSSLQATLILDTEREAAFDDIAGLAATVCRAPVALVSLVDADRQWFKARVGFPSCETDLDRSVCRFVVAEADTIVIPDLAADPRTSANPLVTGDPHVRFYAGAPLVTSGGHVLGALCVLDHAPRAAGLSPTEHESLNALARRTVDAIETRQLARELESALAARERADADRDAAADRLHHVFRTLTEGFILGCAVRDREGRIVDWRYEEVNAAWADLVGVPQDGVVGRTVREVFPGIEEAWIDEVATVVDRGAPIRFTRQVGTLGRWYDGIVQHIDSDLFTVFFVEVTERVARERRQAALIELGDRLRDETSIDGITVAASGMIGRALDVELVGYGDVDPLAETITVARDWTSGDAQTLAGTLNFRDFGSYIDDLKAGETVVVRDSRTDPRTRDFTEALEARSARAFVNTPVFERHAFVGLLYVSTARPRDWSEGELGFIRDVAYRVRLAVERLRAEQQQEVLNAEIAHRMKNSLAMVSAIANQTLRAGTEPERLDAFQQRVRALGTAHDALLGKSLRQAALHQIVTQVLDAAGIDGRYRAEGPPVPLGARATLSASLLFHELATNALKYGALSADGEVLVRWAFEDEREETLALDWIERGGPPAVAPTRKGFGSRLLSLGLTGTGGSTLRYGDEGFSARFTATTEHLESA